MYSYRYKKMFFYRGITSKWERFIKSCVKKCYPRITRRLLRINCVPLHISRGKFPGNIENCSDNEDTGHRLNTSCPSPPIVPLTKINLFDSFISSKQRVINYSSLKLRIKTKSEVKLQKFIRRDKGSLFKKKEEKACYFTGSNANGGRKWSNGMRQFCRVISNRAKVESTKSRRTILLRDSNCRELDVSIDNGGKVQSLSGLEWIEPNKARGQAAPWNVSKATTLRQNSPFRIRNYDTNPAGTRWTSVNGFAPTPVPRNFEQSKGVGGADVGFTFANDTSLLPNHLFGFKEGKGFWTMIKGAL